MAGSDFTFNIAKGKVAYYAENLVKAGTGQFVLMLLIHDSGSAIYIEGLSSGFDDTLKDRVTFTEILAHSTEAIASGGTAGARVSNYIRKYVFGTGTGHDTEIGASPNNSTEAMEADFQDILWAALGGTDNHVIGKLIVGYDPAHNNGSAATDSAVIPMTAHSFDVTPDGSDISALVTYFFRAIDG